MDEQTETRASVYAGFIDPGCQLREDEIGHGNDFEGQKNRLSVENTQSWELSFYPEVTQLGPTRSQQSLGELPRPDNAQATKPFQWTALTDLGGSRLRNLESSTAVCPMTGSSPPFPHSRSQLTLEEIQGLAG